MNVFRNTRNESATTDGRRWWKGTDTDEGTMSICAMQPVMALLPVDEAVAQATHKARAVFISRLKDIAPSVKPDGDAEKKVLAKAWDDAGEFMEKHHVLQSGVPVFDHGLMVVGTADAIVEDDGCGVPYSFCYSAEGFPYPGELNAIARILWKGFPIKVEDDPHGCYDLRGLAGAVMALLLRDRTEWFARNMEEMPF